MTRITIGARRSILRESTTSLHLDLERAIEERRYFANLDSYRDYLVRLHAFYCQLCDAMWRSQGELSSRWGLRDHLVWLTADLSFFGLTPRQRVPVEAAPRIDSRSSAFGAAYVVLGSSLGAKLLASRVTDLELAKGSGATYLENLRSSGNWHRFIDELEREEALVSVDLLRGANETFGSYKAHLIGNLDT